MNFKNFILALVTSSIWGSSFLMIKYSLEELNPSDIAIYRILIGALFINIFVRAKENIIKTDNVKIFIISFFLDGSSVLYVWHCRTNNNIFIGWINKWINSNFCCFYCCCVLQVKSYENSTFVYFHLSLIHI